MNYTFSSFFRRVFGRVYLIVKKYIFFKGCEKNDLTESFVRGLKCMVNTNRH